jgi:hypothetical protein
VHASTDGTADVSGWVENTDFIRVEKNIRQEGQTRWKNPCGWFHVFLFQGQRACKASDTQFFQGGHCRVVGSSDGMVEKIKIGLLTLFQGLQSMSHGVMESAIIRWGMQQDANSDFLLAIGPWSR